MITHWYALLIVLGTDKEIPFPGNAGEPFPRRDEIVIIEDVRYRVVGLEWHVKSAWVHIILDLA